jgi:hypothetical protein
VAYLQKEYKLEKKKQLVAASLSRRNPACDIIIIILLNKK